MKQNKEWTNLFQIEHPDFQQIFQNIHWKEDSIFNPARKSAYPW